MTIDPWKFSPIAVLPYFVVFFLMLRMHFRKDGSGNRRAAADPFSPYALMVGGAALAVAAIYIILRLVNVFIPYGSVWFGGAGLVFMGWALWKNRRAPPPPVQSTELGAAMQKRNAKGVRERRQRPPTRRSR